MIEGVPGRIFEFMVKIAIINGVEGDVIAFTPRQIRSELRGYEPGYNGSIKSIARHLLWLKKRGIVAYRKKDSQNNKLGRGWHIADKEKFNAIKMAEVLSR